MPDPKLKAIAEEIDQLLKKNDIAGVVVLASASNTHYLFELSPSWTCARLETDGFVRIKAMRADFATAADQKAVLERTAGVIMGMHTALTHCAEQLLKLAALMAQKMKIEHMDKHEPPEAPGHG